MKAVCLFSGGLDSILTVHIIKAQGLDVEVLHFYNPFTGPTFEQQIEIIRKSLSSLEVNINVIDYSKEMTNMIKNPKFGFGSGVNPCVDCKILMFKRAHAFMEKTGAKFLATGEVLAQRPMSQQRHQLNCIEKNARIEKILLRPLSAKLMPQTLPEKEGWVNRDKLYAISGRSRKEQIKLAKEFGIESYPEPAGGCLLANPSFVPRIKDLMKYKPDFNSDDVRLLKIGRHFRISTNTKLVVARNEEECNFLESFDKCSFRFSPENVSGPTAVGTGELNSYEKKLAFNIVNIYCKNNGQKPVFKVKDNSKSYFVNPENIDKNDIEKYMI